MADDRPARENPLQAPLVLLDAADSSIPDQLEVVIRRIEQLPEGVRSAVVEQGKYFSAERFEDLQQFWSGLLKIRENRPPSRNELALIAAPHAMLREIAEGLQDAAELESLPFEAARSLERDVADALTEIAARYLPGEADSLAEEWADRITDQMYGRDKEPPGGAAPPTMEP